MCGPLCGLCCMGRQNECRPGRLGEAAAQARLARFGDIHPMAGLARAEGVGRQGHGDPAAKPTGCLGQAHEVTQAGVATLRRVLPIAVDVRPCLFGDEGRPGVNLLTALLNLDSEHSETTKLASLNAEQDPDHRQTSASRMRVSSIERP